MEWERCKDRLTRRKLLLECKYAMKAGKEEAKSTEERGEQHWGWRSKRIGVRNHLQAEEGSKTEKRYG